MAHSCKVDYRSFRQGTPEPARTPRALLPPLRIVPPAPAILPAESSERMAVHS